jgi:hypothetical protein
MNALTYTFPVPPPPSVPAITDGARQEMIAKASELVVTENIMMKDMKLVLLKLL